MLPEVDPLFLAGLVAVLLFTGVIGGIMAGLLGVGGGIVIVPVLYHSFKLIGIDESVLMHVAVATSLATIVATSISSARAHHKKGGIDTALLRQWGPFIAFGVLLGSILGANLDGLFLSAVFGIIALLVSANMALRPDGWHMCEELPGTPGRQIIATVIGFFSVMMGIGGGTLAVPTLTAFNYPIRRAVGTASAIGLIIAVPGAISFAAFGWGTANLPPFSVGYINLVGFILIVPLSVLAAPFGAKLAYTINTRMLRICFAVFLLVTGIRMLFDVATSL
jgi:uncharacterized membrane protein YfcA